MNKALLTDSNGARSGVSAGARSYGHREENTLFINEGLARLLYELAACLPLQSDIQTLCVWLNEPADQAIRLYAVVGKFPVSLATGMGFPAADAIANWVWKRRRTIAIDTSAETRFPEFALALAAADIKCFCGIPLKVGGNMAGVLGFVSTRPCDFRDIDFQFLQQDSRTGKISTDSLLDVESPPDSSHRRKKGAMYFKEQAPCDEFAGIVGRSALLRAELDKARIVAPTGSTALILGETGTGKELIARAIHNLSPRRDRPFIKVNCAAIPAGLVESELFGHERGAFTGAVQRRIGRFEMADGGTLFLDEIGDIPLELQPKLLRVLQEQEFERVGNTQTTRVNVRIVAATSRDLPKMVAAGEFRPDLYYRLSVFPLRVPALRERPDDIPMLIHHFVKLYSTREGKLVTEVPVETMKTLSSYPWPGNVRELQNVIERSVILSHGKLLLSSLDELNGVSRTADAGMPGNSDPSTLKDMEREHIIQALAATDWVIGGPSGAGARLGLPRTTLLGKMRKLGITRVKS